MVASKLSPEEKLARKRLKARERDRNYRERNKEKVALRKKLYCLRHKDEITAYKKRYYIEHGKNRHIIVTCKKGSKSKCSKKSASENMDFQNFQNDVILDGINWNPNDSSNRENMKHLFERVDKRFCHANSVLDDNGVPNPDLQRANICVVCDHLIIGMEEVKQISKEQLEDNAERLSVASYEEHYEISLKRDLVIQYQVEDDDLKDLLLSPRASLSKDRLHYTCCASCYNSLCQGNKSESDNPPKFAIANGFAIGHIPRLISFLSKDGEHKERVIIPEQDLNDVLCSAISPVRPFGYVHAWCGGKEKSLEGHFSFFSVDQSHVGGVINNYNSIRNTAKNIFIVLCGRMTPAQKSIARRQADINTEVFMDLLTWYIKESGHLGYDRMIALPPLMSAPIRLLYCKMKTRKTILMNQ